MKYILGTKEYMSQVFDEKGDAHPVTVISATPNTVVATKSKESDGYEAVVIGAGEKREKNVNKAQKNLGNFRFIKENRGTFEGKKGDSIDLAVFSEGDLVKVTAVSKGKGFQGVVKRHGFAGGRRSHGQKHSEREPGSIGIGGVQRVMKGMRMPGRMGGVNVSVKNLKVVKIEDGKIYIKGAVPGRKGTLVEIRG
ncbi:MAG: 50S ribosomal protein L3 [Candidatus Pacebacteria bacterium]|nr:50S ribosomal protein L3 [Candidatus Paceibacterota bacterium]